MTRAAFYALPDPEAGRQAAEAIRSLLGRVGPGWCRLAPSEARSKLLCSASSEQSFN
jgi:hypothetical protein